MSEYPRGVIRTYPNVFIPDRLVAVIKGLGWLYSSFFYYSSFSRRWSLYGAGKSIWEYAPPLANHLSSQIFGFFIGLFMVLGVWFGRGWAFAYTLITCLSTCVLAVVVHGSVLSMCLAGLIYLPIGLFCTLRLLGTIGPSVGGFELRRRELATEESI